MQRTIGPARGLLVQTGRKLAGRIFQLAGRSVRAPDGKRSNTFVIPAEFSSGSSVLSLGLAVTAVLACSLAGFGGYLASSSAIPREHAVAPVMMMLAVKQPSSEPLPAQPRADEIATVTDAPGGPPSASDVPIPIRSTPSMLVQAPLDSTASVPEPSGDPPEPLATALADDPYQGIWAPNRRACSPRLNHKGFLPAVISSDGAWAGDTSCAFASTKRTGNKWSFAAMCSNSRASWKTTVSLTVTGNRLTWKSARGTQSYVRCEENLQQAGRTQPRV
jgi:hypothetical protein